jgi:5'-3' exonuclease
MQAKSGMVSEMAKRKRQEEVSLYVSKRKSALTGVDVDLTVPEKLKAGLLNVFFSRLIEHLEIFAPKKVIIAMEGRRCWRFDYCDTYKSTRTHSDWDLVITYSEFKAFRDECAVKFAKTFGLHTVKHDKCEGDDILAISARAAAREYDSVVVSTGDRDMLQLTRDPNVFVYDSKDGEFKYPPNKDVRHFLDIKAVGGDRGDAIDGIKLPGKSKAVAKEKFVIKAGGDLFAYCESLGVVDQYVRNRELVDFDYIPGSIKDEVEEILSTEKYLLGNYYDRYSMGLSQINLVRLEQMSQVPRLFKLQTDTVLNPGKKEMNVFG